MSFETFKKKFVILSPKIDLVFTRLRRHAMETKSTVLRNKIKLIQSIKQILNHAMDFRMKLINNYYNKIRSFYNRYVNSISKKLTNNKESNEKILRDCYSGKQFHIKSNDDKRTQLYSGYNDLNNLTKETYSASQPLIVKKDIDFDLDITKSLSQLEINNKENKFLIKECTEQCVFPKYWATILYIKLQLLQPCYNLKTMQNNIIEFEKCTQCYESSSNFNQTVCDYSKGQCQDSMRYLHNLSIHFQRIRTIKRLLFNSANKHHINSVRRIFTLSFYK